MSSGKSDRNTKQQKEKSKARTGSSQSTATGGKTSIRSTTKTAAKTNKSSSLRPQQSKTGRVQRSLKVPSKCITTKSGSKLRTNSYKSSAKSNQKGTGSFSLSRCSFSKVATKSNQKTTGSAYQSTSIKSGGKNGRTYSSSSSTIFVRPPTRPKIRPLAKDTLVGGVMVAHRDEQMMREPDDDELDLEDFVHIHSSMDHFVQHSEPTAEERAKNDSIQCAKILEAIEASESTLKHGLQNQTALETQLSAAFDGKLNSVVQDTYNLTAEVVTELVHQVKEEGSQAEDADSAAKGPSEDAE